MRRGRNESFVSGKIDRVVIKLKEGEEETKSGPWRSNTPENSHSQEIETELLKGPEKGKREGNKEKSEWANQTK